jgi:tripartite-type tricarboxylate transporter receptor subunit TctC
MLGAFGPTIVQPLLSKVSYDIVRDFMPVSLIATAPLVMVVNGTSPHPDFKAFLAAAKSKPDAFNYGTGGTGTLAHLLSETINLQTGLRMQHVPYKGSIQAINDVMAGQLDMVLADPQAVLSHIRGGKMRALMVTSAQRFALLPEVPSVAELGMPQLVALNPWGIYLPANVPEPVFKVFQRALITAMSDPALVKKFADLGVDAQHSSPQELKAFIASEAAKYQKVINQRHIKAE